MIKYYTRACNFYYGRLSKKFIKKKLSLPLCGDKEISFDKIEIFSKNKKKVTSKIKVVSCAPLFADVMRKVQDNTSISGQFLM